MNPTTLENIEAVYGKTEEQYLEEQQLLRELAEEEAREEEAAQAQYRTDDDAEREDAAYMPF